MSRLIDADAMKADLLTVDPQYETMTQWCITVLDAQLTIEPEIIRCGECRYYRECEIFGKKITLCKRREYDSMYTEPDDFCSRAERRKNDQTNRC